MPQKEIKKILIIRLSALGDTIHTLPAVYELRQKFFDAQIDWVVEDKSAKFIVNNPLINNVYVIKRKNRNIKSFFELIKKIRKEKYDVALDFQQLFKSGIILGLSGAKRRIMLDGAREFSFIFANEIIKTGKKPFDINYHVVNRNLDLTRILTLNHILPVEQKNNEIKFVLPDFSNEYSTEIKDIINNLDKTKKTIVIAPATTWENKHWNIENWQNLIKELKDYNIIITATSKEKELTSKILEGVYNSNIIDLTGKTTLADLIYIYKNADLVISPDSGSAHTAWAAEAKSIITLFFATSKNRTAPFGEKYFSLSSNLDCSPCMKKRCRLKLNQNICTSTISIQEVLDLIKICI